MKTLRFLGMAVMLIGFSACQAQGIVAERPEKAQKPSQSLHEENCPSGYLWKKSGWEWNKREKRYEKIEGGCIKIKKGKQWIPGSWTRVAGGWKWEEGYWRKI
jgi:hypothetical protein